MPLVYHCRTSGSKKIWRYYSGTRITLKILWPARTQERSVSLGDSCICGPTPVLLKLHLN
jgi:hypothetical protein